MSTVLVTGFKPFDQFSINPSERIAREIDGTIVSEHKIASRVLGNDTLALGEGLRKAFRETHPVAVILIGLAPSRFALSIERVAVNFFDHAKADSFGTTRRNDPIDSNGPPARFATIPVDAIIQMWADRGLPGFISNSAGTYLCNQSLYIALGIAEEMANKPLCGFIHVPLLPEQAAQMEPSRTPSMALETMKAGVRAAIEATLNAPQYAVRQVPIGRT